MVVMAGRGDEASLCFAPTPPTLLLRQEDLDARHTIRVMAGLVPAIHVLGAARRTWMPGTSPGMTNRGAWEYEDVLLPGHNGRASSPHERQRTWAAVPDIALAHPGYASGHDGA